MHTILKAWSAALLLTTRTYGGVASGHPDSFAYRAMYPPLLCKLETCKKFMYVVALSEDVRTSLIAAGERRKTPVVGESQHAVPLEFAGLHQVASIETATSSPANSACNLPM